MHRGVLSVTFSLSHLLRFGPGSGLAEQAGLALLLEPVALALDVDGRGVMQQPVQGNPPIFGATQK